MTKHEYISFGYLSELKCNLSGLYNIDHTDNEKVNPITVEIVGIGLREVKIHEIGRNITEHYEICDCFPILRPLSDLNIEIEHKGEKFIPIVRLAQMRSSYLHESEFEKALGRLKLDIITKRLPFDLMIKLIEWHFNLLDNHKEAVDYHTLPDFVF